MDRIAREFLEHDYRAVPAVVRQWIADEQLRALLTREWTRNEQLITDASFAESFYERFPLAGAEARDFSYRIIEIESGRTVLASIRFKGLDKEKPFVEVVHRNFALDSAADALALARAIAKHYSVFAPRWIRLYDSSGVLESGDGVFCDFRYYAAPVQELLQRPLPLRWDELAFEPLSNLDFYDEYAAMYARLYAESPHLRVVPVESQQTMTDYLNNGALYRIVIGGNFAGVAGVLAHEERFLHGYLVVEEILDSPFRRQGFATAIQRRMVEAVRESSGVLFGSISPINTPSLRTAAKAGRVDVGGMYLVEVRPESA